MKDSEEPQTGLDRRKLLTLGGVAVLAPFLGRVARAQSLAQAAAGPAGPAAGRPVAAIPLSVGYLQGSDALERLEFPLTLAQVVPASDLAVGETNWAGAAVRLRVLGLFPESAIAAHGMPDSVLLTVRFASPDAARLAADGKSTTIPFYAWEWKRLPARGGSPPTKFVVPIGADGTLNLGLRVVPPSSGGHPAAAQMLNAKFSVFAENGRPKLQRGIYLLGFTPTTWSQVAQLSVLPKLASVALAVESAVPAASAATVVAPAAAPQG